MGVVVLGLACVFVGFWVRSQRIQDQIFFPVIRRTLINPISTHGMVFVRIELDSQFSPATVPGWRVVNIKAWPSDTVPAWQSEWRWRLFGVGASHSTNQSGEIHTLVASYWSIVIPLTLLSAWLLVGKPHSKSTTPVLHV